MSSLRIFCAVSIAMLIGLLSAVDLGPGNATARAARASADPPNVIFIYADDLDLDSFKRRFMPQTWQDLVEPGTTFKDFVVSSPVCCPSRVSYITGQYPHNNGVFSNAPGYQSLRNPRNTLPAWLPDHATGWVGKFLHNYGSLDVVAPGFDDWFVTLKAAYYDYQIGTPGELITRGSDPADYHTDVMTDRAVQLINLHAASDEPMFLTVNYLAPHATKGVTGRCAGGPTPADQDFGAFSDQPLPDWPAFNEPNVSDKPSSLRNIPQMSPSQVAAVQRRYQCRLESLQAMDRGIDAIHDAVKRAGELGDTVFMFTSDNGVVQGQHRLVGKNVAYEEGIHLPLVVTAPRAVLGTSPPERVKGLVSNVDLAPTILDLLDAEPCMLPGRCRVLDGRSFLRLLAKPGTRWPSDRGVLIESGRSDRACRIQGIRTPTDILFREALKRPHEQTCGRAKLEYYDLEADPDQLHNHAGSRVRADRRRVSELRARLRALLSCSGSSCE